MSNIMDSLDEMGKRLDIKQEAVGKLMGANRLQVNIMSELKNVTMPTEVFVNILSAINKAWDKTNAEVRQVEDDKLSKLQKQAA